MDNSRKKAVIYCRVSTQEQVQKDALAVQIKEAEKAAEENGWELTGRYVEMESGTTKRKRTEYLRLLRDMREPELFDIIIIKSLDRLNRSAKNWYLFVEELVCNDKLLFVYMDRNFYKADDNLTAGIKSILAEQYSRDLSRKINNAHAYRQRNGTTVLLNNNTYGYRKNKDKSVSIEPKEAEMVKKIYELAAQGYGSWSISNLLYEEGVRNRKGRRLEDSSIRRIIKNPLFKGTVVMNKTHFDFEKKKCIQNPKTEWIYHENRIPPIVEASLWEKANAMMLLNVKKEGIKKVSEKRKKNLYDISGKIYCGLCGAVYYKTSRKRRSSDEMMIEWKCSAYLKSGRKHKNDQPQYGNLTKDENIGCDNIHISQDGLVQTVRELSSQYLIGSRENFIEYTMRALAAVFIEESRLYYTENKHSYDKTSAKKCLEDIQKRKNRLLDLLLENVITRQEYQRKKQDLDNEEKQAEERKTMQGMYLSRIMSTKEKQEEIRKKLLTDGYEKIMSVFFLLIIKRITVYEKKLVLEFDGMMIKELRRAGITAMDDYLEVQAEKYFPDKAGIRKEKQKLMLDILQKNPEITNQQLADQLGISFKTVRRWLAKYKKQGQVYFEGKGGKGQWKVKFNQNISQCSFYH